MQKINAIIRYHYKIDPETLSHKKWTALYNEYLYVTNRKNQDTEIIFKSAFAEVMAKAFK